MEEYYSYFDRLQMMRQSSLTRYTNKLREILKKCSDAVYNKLINLTAREQMLLEKIRKENEVKSKTSVAVIIVRILQFNKLYSWYHQPIDVDEEEDRKKLIAKLEKQKEILDLLDEVIVEYALNYFLFSKTQELYCQDSNLWKHFPETFRVMRLTAEWHFFSEFTENTKYCSLVGEKTFNKEKL